MQLLGIPKVNPIVLNIIDHAPDAFTQGLNFHNHHIYESTGLEGQSSLRRLDPKTGKIELLKKLEKGWAEGIAIHDDHLVQLTWKTEVAHIYSLDDLVIVGKFYYKGEGWGLSAGAGKNKYIMSNGTNILSFRDKNFYEIGTLHITLRGSPVDNINDLVYVQANIYVNILNENIIYQISANSGKVTKIIDCNNLVNQAKIENSDQVLNGITYDPAEKCFFLTGKNWKKMFKVSIPD